MNKDIKLKFYKTLDLESDFLCEFKNFLLEFSLQDKRLHNFLISKSLVAARNSNDILVGIVFVSKKFYLLNNITWLISRSYRGQGLSGEMLNIMQDRYFTLFAMVRNKDSLRVAEKNGFFILFKKFCFWFSVPKNF